MEWLWKVDSYNLKYSISNSPKGVLDIVFCAWINESALSVDKKIELARKAIENYPNAWDVIASKLPQGTNSICSTLNTPKYRKIDEHEELYVHEVNKTYIEYLMMCVDSACTDAEKWNKIIQHIKSYDVTIQNEVFKKLILNCREMCDEEKIKIKNEMRYEIYRHRYYHDADWSISEWMCRNVLEWEQMKCMQKIMKNDPTFYAQLVRIIYKADDDDPSDKKKRELANKMYSGFDKAKFCPTEKDGKVSYENLKNWIEKFKELLVSQKQERLFGNLVGRLLAYSPIGEDGYSPCEAVRKIIEEYHSDSLKTSYVVAEENKRGVHTVDAGKSELILHHRYKKNAEGLQEQYPRTAEIYFTLSDIYKREADFERKRAEDEW